MGDKKFEQADLMTLTELEQVRVLADPLRVKVIEILCRHERTTKQVAEELGEKPTRLYHHVEALEKVGLIRQTRTRRNRGTLERYYRAVARAFRAESTLFRSEGEDPTAPETVRSVIATLFDKSREELVRLVETGVGPEEIAEEGVLSFLEIHAGEEDLKRVQRRILELLDDLRSLETESAGSREDPHHEDSRRYRLTLAFYPLDRFTDPPSGED